MPSLTRGKENLVGVIVGGVSTETSSAERRLVPVSFALTSAYPNGADGSDGLPVTASSGNQANAVATATIGATAGKTAYLTGFDIIGTGATAASVVAPTITGLTGGTKTFALGVVAGVTGQNPSLSLRFSPPLPASAVNTAIAVSCPALGAGSTNSTVNAYGFYL